MSWAPQHSVVRILVASETAGTGFLVAGRDGPLIVTCAHVIEDDAGAGPGDAVEVTAYPANGAPAVLAARVEPEYWRDARAEDVAILRPEGEVPVGCPPVALATLLDERGEHRCWGFSFSKATEGIGGYVTHLAPSTDGGADAMSARSEEVSLGFSGAPVWDDDADAAIGMVLSLVPAGADPAGRQQRAFFLRTTSELWAICSELRVAPENPYRGLEVFEEEHASLYHGRSRAIADLLQRLSETDFVAVVGPSGSGKSSLVRAGLRKGLAERPVLGLVDRPRARFKPGAAPRLALVLAAAEVAAPRALEPQRLLPLAPEALAAAIREGIGRPAILVADQFEQLFTECRDAAERRDFIDALVRVGSEDVKVVLTLRADFYGRVLEHAALGTAVERGQVTLLPMTREDLLEAVREPARVRLRSLELGLAELLVDDVVGRPGDLPLLQGVLTELWSRDAETGPLRRATYQALGAVGTDGESLRVRGVIARLAEDHWQRLGPGDRAAATTVLLALVSPTPLGDGGGIAQASRRAWFREWDPATQAVAEDLVAARLLTAGIEPATGERLVEVAHEALISAWPRLRSLAQEHADFVRWYDAEFASWLRGWERSHRSTEQLLRGEPLRAAEHWLATAPALLTEPAVEFISAAAAQRAAEEERVQRDAERERERKHALGVSESLRLASDARDAAEAEPETAFLVAWEALLRDRNELSEAVFRETLGRLPAAVRVLRLPRSRVVAGCAGDDAVFGAGETGDVEVHDLDGAPVGAYWVEGAGTTMLAAFHPATGNLLTCRSGVLWMHDPTGEIVAFLELPGAPAGTQIWHDLSVADDGRTLVHLGVEGWLVDVTAGSLELVWTRKLAETDVFHATLERDGATIVVVAYDGVRLCDADGSVRTALEGSSRPTTAALLADGTVIVGGMNGDGAAWGPGGGAQTTFREAGEEIDFAVTAVDAQRRHFAGSATGLNTIEVRDASCRLLATLSGHDGNVRSAAFSPDGALLASGGQDRTVRVWDWTEEHERLVLHGHHAPVDSLAFHPTDGTRLLSADQDGSIRLWRLDGAAVPPLTGHEGPVNHLVTMPAGLLSSGADRTTRLWSPAGRGTVMDGALLHQAGGFALTVDGAPRVRLWALDAPVPRLLWEPLDPRVGGRVFDLELSAVAPGGHVALVQTASVTLWSASGESLGSLVGSDDADVDDAHHRVRAVGFSPDGARVAVASQNGMVWIWNVDGTRAATFLADDASPDRIFDVAIDPRGEMIAVGVRHEAGLWGWDGVRVGSLRTTGYKVNRLAFSPQGSRILTTSSGDSTVTELWTRDGERVAVVDAVGADPAPVPLFDARDRFFCVGSPRGLAIVDGGGDLIGTLAGPVGTWPVATAIAPGGELVASAFNDGVTRIWSLAARRRTMQLRVGDVRTVTFDAEGRTLVAGSSAGPIHRHPLEIEDLFGPAAERVDRALTDDALERFGIDAPLLDLARVRADGP